jgi:hypothetical protein
MVAKVKLFPASVFIHGTGRSIPNECVVADSPRQLFRVTSVKATIESQGGDGTGDGTAKEMSQPSVTFCGVRRYQ